MIKGITLGKFAPLHKGHQFLIEYALSRVDELTIVIYACEELSNCPLDTRISWIKELYPLVRVIPAPDGPLEVGYTPEITHKHDMYLKQLLKGQQYDFFFSSEPYGEHVSKALNCSDIRVDQTRAHIPISATMIRGNVNMYQKYVSPMILNCMKNKQI